MEEKKLILKMLEEGKITAEQAEKLLDALSTSSSEEDESNDFENVINDEDKVSGFFTGIGNFVKNTVKSAMESVETASNTFGDFKGNQRSKSDMKKSFRKDLTSDVQFLKVNVGESQVSIKKTNEDRPYVKVWVNKDLSEDEFNRDFKVENDNGEVVINQKIVGKDEPIHIIGGTVKSRYSYSSIMEIYLTDDISLEDVDISSQMGGINITDLEGENINLKTNFGGIKVQNLEFEDVNFYTNAGSINASDIDSENFILCSELGSMKIQDIDSEIIELTTSAGSLSILDCDAETIKLSSQAGSIKAYDLTSDMINASTEAGSLSFKDIDATDLNLSTNAGSIYIEEVSDNIENIDGKTNAGSIKVDLSSIDKEINAKLSSTLGSIRYPDNYRLINSSNGIKEIYKDGDGSLYINLTTNFGSIKIL